MLTALSWYPYVELTRLNKPIGIWLLLWPTCWALWLAAGGVPPSPVLAIFIAGVVLMRSAGCIVNDIFDRNFDRHVARTRLRPLAAGTIRVTHAWLLALLFALTAFLLVLFCNRLTIYLSFAGVFFALCYPLLKRITHLPQLGLGVAFSWGVPMAFAAVTGEVSRSAWLVFFAAAFWPVIYDTMYAMTDRSDDVQAGVKSTAILFGRYEMVFIALLILCFLSLLMLIGRQFQLQNAYYFSLILATLLFARQLWLIHLRDPEKCFQAFMENNYIGLVIFVGIALKG